MILFSFKINKKYIFYISTILFFFLTLCFFLFYNNNYSSKTQNQYIFNSTNNSEDKIQFLSKFGWEVDPDPIEVFELIIPFYFNDTYSNYNDIQKQNGFDLTKYKGKHCKRFVYKIRNYPNYSNYNSNNIRANILTYNGKIIGGDISSVELNGFMHGFSIPKA